MSEERRASDEWPPKTIARLCPTCKRERMEPNGAHYRDLRYRAHVTLVEMARVCRVTPTHLSLIERGIRSFLPKYAELYEQLFERRKATAPAPGRSPRHGRV